MAKLPHIPTIPDDVQIPTFAVIPTNGRDVLIQAVDEAWHEFDQILLVVNGSDHLSSIAKLREAYADSPRLRAIFQAGQTNISSWWNRGLNLAQAIALEHDRRYWNVAVINDDVLVPSGWSEYVGNRMRSSNVAAVSTGGVDKLPILHTKPGPVNLYTRMSGYAFMVRGEQNLRFDEQFQWWYGDDDFEWRAREAGGVMKLPGIEVNHLSPNGQMTPALQVLAAEDRERFQAKWKMLPW